MNPIAEAETPTQDDGHDATHTGSFDPGEAWDWIVATYETPGVKEACLTWQNGHGHNVMAGLWIIWLAASGRAPTPEAMAEARRIAGQVGPQVLTPLRTARAALKALGPTARAPDLAEARQTVFDAEMAVERALLFELATLDSVPSNDPAFALARVGLIAYAKPDEATSIAERLAGAALA